MLNLKIDPSQTALIVVDVQVDFCSPDGRTGKKGLNTIMQTLPGKINLFSKELKSKGGVVIYAKAVVDENTMSESQKLFIKVKGIKRPTIKGSGGEELYGLDIDKESIIVEKRHADAFAFTNLKNLLLEKQIKYVLVCGVRTEICVDATARRSASEDFITFILSDLSGTRNSNIQDQAYSLKMFDNYHGYVMSSIDLKKLFI